MAGKPSLQPEPCTHLVGPPGTEGARGHDSQRPAQRIRVHFCAGKGVCGAAPHRRQRLLREAQQPAAALFYLQRGWHGACEGRMRECSSAREAMLAEGIRIQPLASQQWLLTPPPALLPSPHLLCDWRVLKLSQRLSRVKHGQAGHTHGKVPAHREQRGRPPPAAGAPPPAGQQHI